MNRDNGAALLLALATSGSILSGCSIRSIAVNSLGNALAKGGSNFASDEDPELVREAVPFGLKTMEGLLEEAPRHKGLLFATCSGFTQYAYAFIEQDADFAEAQDLAKATALRERARRMYLRARRYGFRGLELDLPGFPDRLRADAAAVLARTRKQQVGLLYWTANAWGAAISLKINDPELAADQDLAAALMKRALELDEGYEMGSGHDFFIAYEAGRASVGGSRERARQHFERSVQLSKGLRAWPYVTFAESVAVARQDRKEFETLLDEALAVDVNKAPDQRLANTLAQRRAHWLLSRADELFIE